MEDTNRHQLPERNPLTHAQHRKEAFWQIIFPLLVGILVVLAAVAAIIYSALRPATELSRWADVSLIWLILPALFIALILLVILIGMGYAVSVLLRLIPRYARLLQLYFEVGKDKTSRVTDLIISPIIKSRSLLAVVRHVTKRQTPPAAEP